MHQLKLPPRQKKIIQRKPDPSLSRSQTSRKKLNSTQNLLDVTPKLDLSFISLKDQNMHTPKKMQSSNSITSFLDIKSKNPTASSNNQYLDQHQKVKTFAETVIKGKTSFSVKNLQNQLQNLSQTKSHNQIVRLRIQNECLLTQNKKLTQQIQRLKRQKGTCNNAKNIDLLSQYKKQNEQLKYQCHYMTTTISELQQKILLNSREHSELKLIHQNTTLQLQYSKQSQAVVSSLNLSLIQVCNSLKTEVQNLSQQIRYLNISLGIKSKNYEQMKHIQKQNSKKDELRKRNKQLHKRIIQLKQKVLIDEIVELTPEKDRNAI